MVVTTRSPAEKGGSGRTRPDMPGPAGTCPNRPNARRIAIDRPNARRIVQNRARLFYANSRPLRHLPFWPAQTRAFLVAAWVFAPMLVPCPYSVVKQPRRPRADRAPSILTGDLPRLRAKTALLGWRPPRQPPAGPAITFSRFSSRFPRIPRRTARANVSVGHGNSRPGRALPSCSNCRAGSAHDSTGSAPRRFLLDGGGLSAENTVGG